MILPVGFSVPDIRDGLPFGEATRFAQLLNLSYRDVADLLLISERTFGRRQQVGRFTQAESDRLVRFLHLVREATVAFDHDLPKAVQWLTTSKSILNNESPLYYADTEPGLQAVRDMLGVIQFSMAA